MRKLSTHALLILSLGLANVCFGASGPTLIVNDGAGGLSTTVTTNLSSKLVAAGYTVTTNVGVPAGSLASYKQIWDVRYNNSTPLTASDVTAYTTYMQGGGSLFLMGENTGFMTRNNSITAFVSSLGGPSLTATNPANNTQTVVAPFTGPNSVTTITFLAAAAVASPGNGGYITKDSSNFGAAIVFGPGNLTGAPLGSLLIVFDVNFMDIGADANSQALLANMVAYLAAPTPVGPGAGTPVPTLSEWGMIILACGLAVVASLQVRARRTA